MSKPCPRHIVVVCFILATGAAYAQPEDVPQLPPIPTSVLKTLDLTVDRERLTAGYPTWRNESLRGAIKAGPNLIQGELSNFKEFGVGGQFAGLADTIDINSDWYGRLGAGKGTGAFYLPRFRTDGAVYKKWLERKNLVTYVGAGFYAAPDGHIDRNINLGLIYYFQFPVITELGVRFNRSNPGQINSHQQFFAITYRFLSKDTLVLRHAWGSEGYLPLSANTSIVGFDSNETSFAWRHYIRKDWGVSASVNHYHNPNYSRTGILAGVFYAFD